MQNLPGDGPTGEASMGWGGKGNSFAMMVASVHLVNCLFKFADYERDSNF